MPEHLSSYPLRINSQKWNSEIKGKAHLLSHRLSLIMLVSLVVEVVETGTLCLGAWPTLCDKFESVVLGGTGSKTSLCPGGWMWWPSWGGAVEREALWG